MQNAKLAHLEAQLKARRLAAEQQAKHKDKIDLEKKSRRYNGVCSRLTDFC